VIDMGEGVSSRCWSGGCSCSCSWSGICGWSGAWVLHNIK